MIRAVLAGVLIAAALATPGVAAARSAKKAFWGPAMVNGVSQFPTYADLGVGIYQTQLRWEAVAPERPKNPADPADPAYRWSQEIDYAIEQASRYKMQVLIMLIGAPPWANGGKPWNWAPTDPGDFAAFAQAASRRYPGVHQWMIWGEPNRVGDFNPIVPEIHGQPLSAAQASAPHLYAQLLDGAYGALKSVSPHNLVIGGNSFTDGDIFPLNWIQNLRLPDGRPPRLDVYGHNPFSARAPNLRSPQSPLGQSDFSDIRRLAHWLDLYLKPRGKPLPIFISEFTLNTGPNREFPYHVSERTQAKWLADGLDIVKHTPRISALGWIPLHDDPPTAASDGSFLPTAAGGLIDAAGRHKPAYTVFKRGGG